MAQLSQTPAAQWLPATNQIQAVYYDNVPYHGQPTRAFAYYGWPTNGAAPYPGLVLVHGGGGTARKEWVEYWRRRGYAALAIDLGGRGPNGPMPDGWPEQSEFAVFGDFQESEANQRWPYQAVAAIVRGVSLIASRPEVDTRRLGLQGVSWGGVLGCIAAGIDPRIQAVASAFGTGFLHEDTYFLHWFAWMNDAQKARWVRLFDPSSYLGQVECPMLFLIGANDPIFHPNIFQRTVQAVRSPVTACLRPFAVHADPTEVKGLDIEINAFLDSLFLGQDPLPQIGPLTLAGTTVSASFTSAVPVVSGALCYCGELGAWTNRIWQVQPADIRDHQVSARLPARRPLMYYLVVSDSRGALVSTPFAWTDSDGPAETPEPLALGVRFRAAEHPFAVSNAWALAAGDFNQDGQADLAVTGFSYDGSMNGELAILLGRGDGTFVRGSVYSIPNPRSAAAVDINADNLADLVTAQHTPSAPSVGVLLGQGGGKFTAMASYSALSPPYTIMVADFNGDGQPDLATAGAGQQFVGASAGAFLPPTRFGTGGESRGLALGDFNEDGRPDIVTGTYISNAVTLAVTDAAGRLTPTADWPVGSQSAALAAGDVNEDGHLDLLAASSAEDLVAVLLGHGDGTLRLRSVCPTGRAPAGLAVGDLNQDGHLDFVAVNTKDNTVNVFSGRGDGSFSQAARLAVGPGPTAVVLVDADGDGRLDVLTANHGDGTVSVLLSLPAPHFKSLGELPGAEAAWRGDVFETSSRTWFSFLRFEAASEVGLLETHQDEDDTLVAGPAQRFAEPWFYWGRALVVGTDLYFTGCLLEGSHRGIRHAPAGVAGWSTPGAETTPLPAPAGVGDGGRSFHQALAYGGRLYVLGGWSGVADSPPYADVHHAPVLPTGGLGAFETTTPLPVGVFGHSAAVSADGWLYVAARTNLFRAWITPTGAVSEFAALNPIAGMDHFNRGNNAMAVLGSLLVIIDTTRTYVLELGPEGQLESLCTAIPNPAVFEERSVYAAHGQVYVAAASGAGSGRGARLYRLDGLPVEEAPRLLAAPTAQTVLWGGPAVLEAIVAGAPPLRCQWRRNGQEVPGATNTTLVLPEVRLEDAGDYRFTASNRSGSVTSEPVRLTVRAAEVSIGLCPRVLVQGTPGRTFSIQYTTQLAPTNDWITVTNLTLRQEAEVWADVSVDTRLTNPPKRFYRVIPAP